MPPSGLCGIRTKRSALVLGLPVWQTSAILAGARFFEPKSMTGNPQEEAVAVPPDLLLQYLVVLSGTDPLVWRRIQVPATYSFWDLHVAIQSAMGWRDAHLHRFRAVDAASGVVVTLAPPDPEGWSDATPEQTVGVLDYARFGAPAIHYTYDFGDDWHHTLIFEGYDQAEGDIPAPECVGGAGACPPEDSGGPHGYAETLQALADPEAPQRDELLEWMGEDWDPHAFAPEDVRFDDPEQRWREAYGEP